MESAAPPLIDYSHPRPRPRQKRFRLALALTILAGFVAGIGASYAPHPLAIIAGYSFCCPLLMGLLAGRSRITIAIAACLTLMASTVTFDVAKALRHRIGATMSDIAHSELVPWWGVLLMWSAFFAALAVILGKVLLTAERNVKAERAIDSIRQRISR